jgi:hypothetical protein
MTAFKPLIPKSPEGREGTEGGENTPMLSTTYFLSQVETCPWVQSGPQAASNTIASLWVGVGALENGGCCEEEALPAQQV